MTSSSNKRILVVDDDDTFRERLASSMRRRGHEVAAAAGREDALASLESFHPDCAVIDLRLENDSGLNVARDLSERIPGIRVLILTGYGSIATAVDAMRLGAVDYLRNPPMPMRSSPRSSGMETRFRNPPLRKAACPPSTVWSGSTCSGFFATVMATSAKPPAGSASSGGPCSGSFRSIRRKRESSLSSCRPAAPRE